MEEMIDIILNQYQLFILIFVRVSGIFIFSPFFSSQNIPNIMKIGLSFSITLLIAIVIPIDVDIENQILLIVIIKELMVGIIIGFISYVFMTAFYVLGQIVDMNIGFGMANVVDPQNKVQVPLMGNFYYILSFLFMLLINGHHKVISALIDSYNYIPIGKLIYNDNVIEIIVNALVKSFEIGFKLSLPVVAIIFLTDIVLGIMAKAIPQMNVFVIGMPLKVFIGLAIIMITIPIFYNSIVEIFNIMVNDIYRFMKL